MAVDDKLDTSKKYTVSDGEPAGINKEVWNGNILEYQRKVLNQIANEKDSKKRFNLLLECAKISIIVNSEMEKATYYKTEYDAMATFLDNIGILHVTKDQEEVTDQQGKKHMHTYNERRSLVKSIPTLRGKLNK